MDKSVTVKRRTYDTSELVDEMFITLELDDQSKQ